MLFRSALKRAYVFGEEALFSIIKSELPHETLELGSIIKENNQVIKKIKLISLSKKISKQINDIFIAGCPTYRQILPHILSEEANQRKFLLSFFLERQIGKACLSFAKETVKNARRTFALANIITRDAVATGLLEDGIDPTKKQEILKGLGIGEKVALDRKSVV